MNRKTAIIISITLLLIIISALTVFGLTQLYYYSNPEVEIHVTTLKNADIDRVTISYNERSRFGMNPEAEIKIRECGSQLRKLYEKLELKMDAPRSLKVEVVREPDKTKIMCEGYGTRDGIQEDINMMIVLDMPVTDVIWE